MQVWLTNEGNYNNAPQPLYKISQSEYIKLWNIHYDRLRHTEFRIDREGIILLFWFLGIALMEKIYVNKIDYYRVGCVHEFTRKMKMYDVVKCLKCGYEEIQDSSD